jgi:hypothetical protein
MYCISLGKRIRYCRHSLTHLPVPIPGTAHRAHLAGRPLLTQFPEAYLRAGQGHHGQGHLKSVQILEEAFSEKLYADLEQ